MLGIQDSAAGFGEVALHLDVTPCLRCPKRSAANSTAFYAFDFGLDRCLAFSFGRRPGFDVQLRLGLKDFCQPLLLVSAPARQLIPGGLVLVPAGRLGCSEAVPHLGFTPRYVRVAHRLVLGRTALLFVSSGANKAGLAKPALTAGTCANNAARLWG